MEREICAKKGLTKLGSAGMISERLRGTQKLGTGSRETGRKRDGPCGGDRKKVLDKRT